jgi:hypothetical protein
MYVCVSISIYSSGRVGEQSITEALARLEWPQAEEECERAARACTQTALGLEAEAEEEEEVEEEEVLLRGREAGESSELVSLLTCVLVQPPSAVSLEWKGLVRRLVAATVWSSNPALRASGLVDICAYTHTYTHTHIHMYVYIYMYV